jgi:hypothetical protein
VASAQRVGPTPESSRDASGARVGTAVPRAGLNALRGPAAVLALQRTAGNRAVLRALGHSGGTLARCRGTCTCGGACTAADEFDDSAREKLSRAVLDRRRTVPGTTVDACGPGQDSLTTQPSVPDRALRRATATRPQARLIQRDEDGDDDQPDCLLADRIKSTEWAITNNITGTLGVGLAGGTLAFTLVNKASGTAHPVVFVGVGAGAGAKPSKKLPKAGKVPPISIGNPTFTDFTTDEPQTVRDFGGFGAIVTAGLAFGVGFSLTFAKLAVSTSPGMVNVSGISLGAGVDGQALAGFYKTFGGFCVRATPAAVVSQEDAGGGDQFADLADNAIATADVASSDDESVAAA